MNKDEIDLSAFPSYLGVSAGAEQADDAGPREAVVRGLLAAAMVGLVGVVLGVAVPYVLPVRETFGAATGTLTSGAMVLLYTRAAGAAPRRGLLALVVLLLMILATTFCGMIAAKAWWVYSLMTEDMNLPLTFSRASFVWGAVADPDLSGIVDDILFLLILFSLVGSCLALWQVRRRREP